MVRSGKGEWDTAELFEMAKVANPHHPCKNTIKHNKICIKFNTMQRKKEKTEKIIVE